MDVDADLNNYNPTDAGRKMEDFVDDLPTGMSGEAAAVSGRARMIPIKYQPIILFIPVW